MFFYRGAAVKTVKGVEKHLFSQEIRWNNVPLPGSYIWKISSEHKACQRIMAEIA